MAQRAFWSETEDELLRSLESTPSGLSQAEADRRLDEYGPNTVSEVERRTTARLLLAQFANPLTWLLLFAVIVSSIAREWTDAAVIVAILLLGALLGFIQEHRAEVAVQSLRARLALRSEVVRDGASTSVPSTTLVPGDIVELSAGSLVPADGIVLRARDFNVSESVLTGESYPVEKSPGIVASSAPIQGRTNSVFHGSSVRSGTGRILIVRTGKDTEYGHIAERLALRAPETDFDRGLRRFGHLLTRLMFVLVMFTTTANLLADKPAVESLLFAIALAVGLAPEMLPAVVAINLSRGAKRMANKGVIVRKLSAIENFGSMDVLCTDKTGTLTEGRVMVERATDANGNDQRHVFDLAWINASNQTGLPNPLDTAILERAEELGVGTANTKVDEIPYDFSRKRLTVVMRDPQRDGCLLVTKGAVTQLLEVCAFVRSDQGAVRALDDEGRRLLQAHTEAKGLQGIRCLGVATKEVDDRSRYGREDEAGLVFEGLLELRDRPKEGVLVALRDLRKLGVDVKMVTGDSRSVAAHLAKEIDLPNADQILTGAEVAALRDEALWHAAERTAVFAEVDPNQKERIILALRKMGHVVGFMGDGINDAAAIHSADVGISVEGATDVARDAAEFVLLDRDLRVLHEGILEGRTTFANTLKYLLTTESANFGNMVSMAIAAAFLPFLPLLAGQVLLNNFLSDIPAMAIATDGVDPERLERPIRWDIGFIKRFMVVFGVVSSIFDLATFGILVSVLHSTPKEFRTGWFIESLLTELAVALVVRTQRPFYRSRPSNALMGLSALVLVVTLFIPWTPVGVWLELVPLPPAIIALLAGITVLYVAFVEGTKRVFFARLAVHSPAGTWQNAGNRP